MGLQEIYKKKLLGKIFITLCKASLVKTMFEVKVLSLGKKHSTYIMYNFSLGVFFDFNLAALLFKCNTHTTVLTKLLLLKSNKTEYCASSDMLLYLFPMHFMF